MIILKSQENRNPCRNRFVKSSKGFTLVELMVSLSIFVLAMILITGAVLSVLNINSRAQSQKTAMDNLNFALESMSRAIRFGTSYHCGSNLPLTTPSDCSGGNSSLSVTAGDGSLVTYTLSSNKITRKVGSGATYDITSPEIIIGRLTFRVFGSTSFSNGDTSQPQVIITVSGTSGSANKPKTQSSFNLETTISQRRLDI